MDGLMHREEISGRDSLRDLGARMSSEFGGDSVGGVFTLRAAWLRVVTGMALMRGNWRCFSFLLQNCVYLMRVVWYCGNVRVPVG